MDRFLTALVLLLLVALGVIIGIGLGSAETAAQHCKGMYTGDGLYRIDAQGRIVCQVKQDVQP